MTPERLAYIRAHYPSILVVAELLTEIDRLNAELAGPLTAEVPDGAGNEPDTEKEA